MSALKKNKSPQKYLRAFCMFRFISLNYFFNITPNSHAYPIAIVFEESLLKFM